MGTHKTPFCGFPKSTIYNIFFKIKTILQPQQLSKLHINLPLINEDVYIMSNIPNTNFSQLCACYENSHLIFYKPRHQQKKSLSESSKVFIFFIVQLTILCNNSRYLKQFYNHNNSQNFT